MLGKREIALEVAAVIADKSRSRQIIPTLIQKRKALNNQRLAPRYGNETPIYFKRAQNFPLPHIWRSSHRRRAQLRPQRDRTFVGCPLPPDPLSHPISYSLFVVDIVLVAARVLVLLPVLAVLAGGERDDVLPVVDVVQRVPGAGADAGQVSLPFEYQ